MHCVVQRSVSCCLACAGLGLASLPIAPPPVKLSPSFLCPALLLCAPARSGLLVSWVMKFADSICKVYATSLAMLLTTLVSIARFGTQPTLQMGLGILVASVSVVLYYVPPAQLAAVPEYEPVPQREREPGGKLPR